MNNHARLFMAPASPLIDGLAIPLHGFGQVLFDPAAVGIHRSQSKLGGCKALVCSLLYQFEGLLLILFHPETIEVHGTQVGQCPRTWGRTSPASALFYSSAKFGGDCVQANGP